MHQPRSETMPHDHAPRHRAHAHDDGHRHDHRCGHGQADHDHDHDHDHGGHDHGHHHGPGHSHAPTLTDSNERVVLAAALVTAGFMLAEVVGGLMSGSLALIADAGHMLTDAAALALAWAAFRFGRRGRTSRKTYGYHRLEVLAGFVNALVLIALTAWIAWEAVNRMLVPQPVLSGPMFWVAVAGLGVNVGVFWILSRGQRDHVNIRGAMVHVMGDLLGSVAAIAAAIGIWLTGWTVLDPVLSLVLSVLVLRSGWALLGASMNILMEGTPEGVDTEAMRGHLAALGGVAFVEHVHVWSITSGKSAATLHLGVAEGADPFTVKASVREALQARFDIGHSTIEIDEQPGVACRIGKRAS
ncbi:cation diffusion facilitator family transporter [Frigidibacter sp. MR17.24]|uniref:cation diffusion facilitator family transporter n=1 Tax=Frigidibacter sp. MR17.24 TaxID=3127345 RepID=UPI00301303FB